MERFIGEDAPVKTMMVTGMVLIMMMVMVMRVMTVMTLMMLLLQVHGVDNHGDGDNDGFDHDNNDDSDGFDDAAVAGARCGTELSANARSWRPGQASA